MDFEKYLSELESDKTIIFNLQKKYHSFLIEHMKKRKNERDSSWNKTRNMLFHISGALSMAGNGIRSYLKDDK